MFQTHTKVKFPTLLLTLKILTDNTLLANFVWWSIKSLISTISFFSLRSQPLPEWCSLQLCLPAALPPGLTQAGGRRGWEKPSHKGPGDSWCSLSLTNLLWTVPGKFKRQTPHLRNDFSFLLNVSSNEYWEIADSTEDKQPGTWLQEHFAFLLQLLSILFEIHDFNFSRNISKLPC